VALLHTRRSARGISRSGLCAPCSLSEKFPDLRSSYGFVAARLKMAAVARELYHRSLENPGKL